MSDQACILVFGIDETASAVARMLLLSGYAVAIHQPAPPTLLRRKMAFADAWYDGASMLDGVQARRADLSSDFLMVALSNRMYIPVLTHPLAEVVQRWPWDVIIDAQTPGERLRAPIKSHAEMTIALGPGPIAGIDCNIVIETFGPDPGATLRSGAAPCPSRYERDKMLDDAHPVVALETGIFTTGRIIGETGGQKHQTFSYHRRNTRSLSCRWTHSRAPAQWPRRRRWEDQDRPDGESVRSLRRRYAENTDFGRTVKSRSQRGILTDTRAKTA